MRILLPYLVGSLAGLFLTGAVGLTSARADTEFAYCAIPGFATSQDCTFYTLGQCQAAVRGLGTACEPNPRYVRQDRIVSAPSNRQHRH